MKQILMYVVIMIAGVTFGQGIIDRKLETIITNVATLSDLSQKQPLENQRLSTTSNVTFNIIKANSLLQINKNPTDWIDGGSHQFEIRAGAGSLMIPFKWDNSAKTIYFADTGVGATIDNYFLTDAHLLTINGDISNFKLYTNTWNTVTNKADQSNLTAIENRTNTWNTVTNKADQVNLTSVSNRVVSIETNTNTWNTVTNKVDVDGNNITNIPAWFVKLGLGTSATNPTSNFILSSKISQSNGVCELDEYGFIPIARIPQITVIFSGESLD